MDGTQRSGHDDVDDEKPVRKRRQNLAPFIVLSVLEEAAIGAVALLVIAVLVPQLALPGALCVAIGLAAFAALKIHYFLSSAAIPVEDSIVGQIVQVPEDFRRRSAGVWTGRVLLRGESWQAVAKKAVSRGMLVRVTEVEGLHLKVVRIRVGGEQLAGA